MFANLYADINADYNGLRILASHRDRWLRGRVSSDLSLNNVFVIHPPSAIIVFSTRYMVSERATAFSVVLDLKSRSGRGTPLDLCLGQRFPLIPPPPRPSLLAALSRVGNQDVIVVRFRVRVDEIVLVDERSPSSRTR